MADEIDSRKSFGSLLLEWQGLKDLLSDETKKK
jgi:hypothetical protein